MTRTAISPRFATRTLLNTVEREGGDRLELEQQLPETDGLRAVDAACLERLLGAAVPDRAQQRSRLRPEKAEEQQLLLARREALGLVAELVKRRDDHLDGLRVRRQRDGALHRRVDLAGR